MSLLLNCKSSVSRDLPSGIEMTPFYRSVPSQLVLSAGGGGGGGGGETHPWPAYQRINSQVLRTSQAEEEQEGSAAFLTVDQMREFLRRVSRQNNNFAAGREVKWSV